ncbi:MAG: S8 family peptidase [Rickettsiales bacterium]|jgi:hypothetical protein|nr:S8 family peptidase [Rickettsiales bacterium]
MPDNNKHLPHLILPVERVGASSFSPKRARGSEYDIPPRNPQSHASKLKRELEEISRNHQEDEIYVLTFSGQQGKSFLYESLERHSADMELLSIKEDTNGNVVSANIRINSQKTLPKLQALLTDYSEIRAATAPTQLIASIEKIEISDISRLFTDDPSLFPNDNKEHWWELWLTNNDADTIQFTNIARRESLFIKETPLVFPDRTIFICKSTITKLSDFTKKCNLIAEIRIAKKLNEPIVNLSQSEQQVILDEIIAKVSYPDNDNTRIVVLDGNYIVNHPLIGSALVRNQSAANFLAISVNYGHATEMGGLALFGDITKLRELPSISLHHKVEAVQISDANNENYKGLYGKLTESAVILTQTHNHNAYIMPITEGEGGDKHRGKPSLWSAYLDKLTFDYDKLFAVSIGNIREIVKKDDYKLKQIGSCIESPAQSWNVLSVGSCTHLADANLIADAEMLPYADAGYVSPHSRTSCQFNSQWPIKPEVLFEGGNKVVYARDGYVYNYDTLEPVGCAENFDEKPFTSINATSASTGIAGQFIGELMASYPLFWPETIRGLVVHSAEWTDKMLEKIPKQQVKTNISKLARIFGYGIPSIYNAKYSASSALTIIAEKDFQAYKTEIRIDNKGRKTKIRRFQMLVFELPWPRAILEQLAKIKLKITLSYFIEPNPSERGYLSKYAYQSHNLRFDLQRPEETPENFNKRINDLAAQENENDDGLQVDVGALDWFYGANSRKRGSVHKDIIEITGAQLADMKHIAIYSVGGWWRNKKSVIDEQTRTRFSLIISVDAGETEINLYNQILTEIQNLTQVPIEIPVQ